MENQTPIPDSESTTRRATRAIGLVLVGTAALMLGMHATGCDNDDAADGSTTTPSSGHGSSGHYYGHGGRYGRSSYSSSGSHTSRGGFGSTGHSVGS